MYATLRNTLLASLSLFLIAAPVRADGGGSSNSEQIAKLRGALADTEAAMADIAGQITAAKAQLLKYHSELAKTGSVKVQDAMSQVETRVRELQREFRNLASNANELRREIAWLEASSGVGDDAP